MMMMSEAADVSVLEDLVDLAPARSPRAVEAEPLDDDEVFEQRIRAEKQAQFKRLKGDAQAIFGAVKGLPGVRSPQKWAEMLEAAGDEIGNGRFIVRQLGAERYLEPETVAVLITLRQNLIADLPRVTAAEIMMIDAAVMAYYNMLRTQGWIGNLSLVVERELFGQELLNAHHGERTAEHIENTIRRLNDVLLPLQDRSTRMMMRTLEVLRSASHRSIKRPQKGSRTH